MRIVRADWLVIEAPPSGADWARDRPGKSLTQQPVLRVPLWRVCLGRVVWEVHLAGADGDGTTRWVLQKARLCFLSELVTNTTFCVSCCVSADLIMSWTWSWTQLTARHYLEVVASFLIHGSQWSSVITDLFLLLRVACRCTQLNQCTAGVCFCTLNASWKLKCLAHGYYFQFLRGYVLGVSGLLGI